VAQVRTIRLGASRSALSIQQLDYMSRTVATDKSWRPRPPGYMYPDGNDGRCIGEKRVKMGVEVGELHDVTGESRRWQHSWLAYDRR